MEFFLFFFFLSITCHVLLYFFFLNDPAPTEFYPLPLPAALPISAMARRPPSSPASLSCATRTRGWVGPFSSVAPDTPCCAASCRAWMADWVRSGTSFIRVDRKSTRLNSSHLVISYAVFCLKKQKT